ncbi:hypothetical protein BGX27_000008 [Mortierella sp. AM989]|nr:hypothetical protein BGX27_000008 [Mortierella sp. AM989]
MSGLTPSTSISDTNRSTNNSNLSESSDDKSLNTAAKRLLVVPQVANDSTTLLQKSPAIDDDQQAFKAIISHVSSSKEQFLKSTNIITKSNEKIRSKEQKEFTLMVVPKDDICKSAVISDDHEQEMNEISTREQKAQEEYILVEQLQVMRAAAATVQFEDAGPLVSAAEKCESVFKHHQKFDQILESEPNQYEAIKALHELVTACYSDTTELIEDWALLYHTLQGLIQRIQLVAAAASASGVTGKSPKTRRSLFSKKSAEEVLPQISPEVLQHQKDVCVNWTAQMKSFEQLARAYRSFADQATSFALIQEIEGIGRYCGEEIHSTFEKSQAEFTNMRQLCHLHYQIDYTNFSKILPKENALTTADERGTQPPRPLFSRDMIGYRQLIRAGKLTEFISPHAAAGSSKKNAAPTLPKEYHLIVSSDMIYLCEVTAVSTERQENSGKSNKKNSQKGDTKKHLRLMHEPVLVIDSQISSTPDVVHPPLIQKNMVMVCFYNQTSYILQAESSEERDAWVECARQLNIEQPKPTDACREQDENEELRRSLSISSISTIGKSKGNRVSLLKRLKSLRRSNINLAEESGPIPEIDPDQLTRTDEEEKARRMQLGQPSLWEVRRLPLDLGVIPPLEHPIPFRKSHLYDSNVKIVDITTGKVAPGEFGMGIEDRAAYFRDECALFAVLRPARLIPFNEIDRQRDDFFLCCKRLYKGEVMYVEPPYITDFYARSWLHPDMHIEFDSERKSVMIAKMYQIICSTSEIVTEFQKYHAWLMRTARISPDNTFLCMDYRSQPLRIAKKIERAAGASSPVDTKVLEAGRKYTELGECNIEFRRMSNAPDALSVGFYNPATKRDMAIGVMVFDKSKVKATASSLGLNALTALGPSNGVMRVSPTEMTLTLWQTDARTRPTFVKGQRVFETLKSKSLDMFKITGQREALDELEEFMRIKNGTDCKAKEITETFKLIRIAFQDDILDASDEEDEMENAEADIDYKHMEEERLGPRKPEGTNMMCQADSAIVSELEQDIVDTETLDHILYGHRADGHLETVLEEEEEGDNGILSGSTATFRPKNRSALILMEEHQKQLAAAEAAQKNLDLCLPQIEPCLYNDLAGIIGGQQESVEEGEEFIAPSVANLAEFWAKTTCAIALVRSSSSTTVAADSTIDSASVISSASSTTEIASSPDPTSELEARVNAVKAAARFSTAAEEIQPQVNANGIVQATRYPLKKSQVSDGAVTKDLDGDIEPGVDMEHHMPVKDLKKRWEEIYRLGI